MSTLRSIHRYPVKSMAGEPIERATLFEGAGIDGDRRLAIVDEESGHVASAKHPRKWAAALECRAAIEDDRVRITLPDGAVVQGDDADVDARLSTLFGRRVRLADTPPSQAKLEEEKAEVADVPLAVAAPAGSFFDFAALHLITTSSLRSLSQRAPEVSFDLARFRPNLLIDTEGQDGFPEDDWLGRELAVGGARLAVISTCPRCVMTTLPQQGLAADPRVLRTIADSNLKLFELMGKKLPSVGVYATVIGGGEIAVGDAVEVVGGARLARAGALLRAVKRAIVR
jgi:uncharacterized protein YcbX